MHLPESRRPFRRPFRRPSHCPSRRPFSVSFHLIDQSSDLDVPPYVLHPAFGYVHHLVFHHQPLGYTDNLELH